MRSEVPLPSAGQVPPPQLRLDLARSPEQAAPADFTVIEQTFIDRKIVIKGANGA